MIYTYENDFKAFVEARSRGELCQIDTEMMDYWLEVLPPVFMYQDVELVTGRKVLAVFGFAEGAERVTAFWSIRYADAARGIEHYAQYCTLYSNGGSGLYVKPWEGVDAIA